MGSDLDNDDNEVVSATEPDDEWDPAWEHCKVSRF
jgi:hypothetical protein